MAETEQTPAELRRENVHLYRCIAGAGIIPLRDGKKAFTAGWQLTRAENQTDEQVEAIASAGNYGVVCGGEGGIDALDLDPTPLEGETVDDAIARTKSELGLAQVVTPEVRTSKGVHMLFAHDPANELGNWVKRKGLPFDIRTTGGQVVGVGSVHASGHVYQWVPGRRLGEVPLAELPASFRARLHAAPPSTPKTSAKAHGDTSSEKAHEQYAALDSDDARAFVDRYLRAGIEREAEQFMRTAEPGNRNDPLLRAACSISEMANSSPSFDIEEIEERLIQMGEASGHDPEAVRKTVASALRRTEGKGRDVQAIVAKRAGTAAPAEIPPAPPVPHDSELDHILTVGAQNGPQTAKAKKVRDFLKAKRPKTADLLAHPDGVPQDQVAQVIKDAVAALRHCQFDDEPAEATKFVLALLRDKTSVALPELNALAWAALHAPKANAGERRLTHGEPRICSTPDGKYCVRRKDGKWDPLPVPQPMLVGRIKELGVDEEIDVYRRDEDGNIVGTKRAQEIIDGTPNTSVVRVVGRLSKGKDDGATIEGMGTPEAVLNVPLRSIDLNNWPPLPPEQFAEIHDYYRHAICNPARVPEENGIVKGADEDKLNHFLDATAGFPREDHRTASTSVVGPGASGKDMYGEAQGRMSGSTAGVDSITGSFQEDLVHTSHGWVNETHGLDRRDIPRFSGKFRRLSGATRNNIARKFRSNIEVHRNYRWLFTANDDGLLHALLGDEGADGNLDGLAATSMRLARFEFTAGAVKWLADRGGMNHTNRPGAEWVGGDPANGGARLVRFIADLARMSIDGSRPITHADPLGRFLVRGTDLASEGRDLLLARGIGPHVLKVVLGQARAQGSTNMVRWVDGCLFAQAQDIAEHITRTDHTKVSAKTVGHVLRHLSSTTTNAERAWDGRRRWWQLDIKIIQAEAARQELSAEFLDQKTSN